MESSPAQYEVDGVIKHVAFWGEDEALVSVYVDEEHTMAVYHTRVPVAEVGDYPVGASFADTLSALTTSVERVLK